jgi:hypothetical protein
MPKSISDYEADLVRAQALLAKEINRAFPVGCAVQVEWGGNRMMMGRVAHATKPGRFCDEVAVVSDNGKHVHRRHYRSVHLVSGEKGVVE